MITTAITDQHKLHHDYGDLKCVVLTHIIYCMLYTKAKNHAVLKFLRDIKEL